MKADLDGSPPLKRSKVGVDECEDRAPRPNVHPLIDIIFRHALIQVKKVAPKSQKKKCMASIPKPKLAKATPSILGHFLEWTLNSLEPSVKKNYCAVSVEK